MSLIRKRRRRQQENVFSVYGITDLIDDPPNFLLTPLLLEKLLHAHVDKEYAPLLQQIGNLPLRRRRHAADDEQNLLFALFLHLHLVHKLHGQGPGIDRQHAAAALQHRFGDLLHIFIAHRIKDENAHLLRRFSDGSGKRVHVLRQIFQRKVSHLVARLLRDKIYNIIRCNGHLRIAPRIRLCQKHAVHEHRSICDDASRVGISGYDNRRKVVTQGGKCPVNLRSDIAAQRRINALVEKFTTRLQLQKGFSDTSESLLGG